VSINVSSVLINILRTQMVNIGTMDRMYIKGWFTFNDVSQARPDNDNVTSRICHRMWTGQFHLTSTTLFCRVVKCESTLPLLINWCFEQNEITEDCCSNRHFTSITLVSRVLKHTDTLTHLYKHKRRADTTSNNVWFKSNEN
jgi:hypothetical protein